MHTSYFSSIFIAFALAATASAQTGTKTSAKPAAEDSDSRTAPRAVPVRNDASAIRNDAVQNPASTTGNAVFRPGDSVDMRISGIPSEEAASFPTPITIGTDGTVNITYVGQIRAAGLTQSQLEKAIE